MFPVEILLLGFALAVDAAVVCFAFGILGLEKPRPERIKHWLCCAATFGLFQFLMLWLGSYAGYMFSFSSYGNIFHLVVAGIFLLMAMKVFRESMEEEEEKELQFGVLPLLVLGLATSIDALAAGISLGTLPRAYEAALIVGTITALMCSLFYLLSQFFKNIPDKWLLRLAGGIFLALGGKIIVETVSRGL